MLFVSPIFLIISTLGFRSGWAEGTLTLVDATARNSLVGDIQVHLGWYNGTVIMSNPWAVIELDVKGAQGWGALVISLCFVCLCGGLFVAYHQEQGTGVDISSKVCKWIIRGGGVTVMFLSLLLFFCLAHSAHAEVQEKLESLGIKDRSLWPHPGLFLLSALCSGSSMLAASYLYQSNEIDGPMYLTEGLI